MRFKLFLLLIILISCNSGKEILTLHVNGSPLQVEIANTPELRTKGLMNRNNLPLDSGMLFIFPNDTRPSFWMKDTALPLSLAYISSDGIIKQIETLIPYSLEPIQSRRNVRYALEVNKGWFTRRNIVPGQKIVFPNNIPKGY